MALLLNQLGMGPEPLTSVEDTLSSLGFSGKEMLTGLRSMSDSGLLVTERLIFFENPDDDICDRMPIVDPALVDLALQGDAGTLSGWPVKIEAELHNHLGRLTRALGKRTRIAGPGRGRRVNRLYSHAPHEAAP